MSTNTIAFKFNPALIASNLTVVSEGGTLFSITGRVPGRTTTRLTSYCVTR